MNIRAQQWLVPASCFAIALIAPHTISSARHNLTANYRVTIQPDFPSTMSKRFIQFARQLAVSAAVSLPLFACAEAIVIGQTIDLSGPNADIGRDYVAGIKTYFDTVNSSGGINGKNIQYLIRDDHGQANLAGKMTAELIERDKVDYLFGGVGDEVTQAVLDTPAFKRSNLVLFAPLAGADRLDKARVLFWRPSYKQEVQHIFSHFGKLGIKSIGVVYQDSSANQDAYRSLSNEVKERGMNLAGTVRLQGNGNQLNQDARLLAASKPGFVVVIADTISTGLFLKEFRKYDAQTFIASTSLINLSTLRELAGPTAVEWTVFSQVVPDPNAGKSPLQVEHQNMMKKYRDEAVSALTLEGFAAAKTLVKAIQQAKHGNYSALQDLNAQNNRIDLGGIPAVFSPNNNHLSNYLDIALFKKSGGLKF